MTSESFAPVAAPLHGVVSVPGSKSVSNRALVCAALADGQSVLTGVAVGDDTMRMIDALRTLGAQIECTATTVWVRSGVDRGATSAVIVDAGLAGTTSRFVSAIAALRAGPSTITGGAGLLGRPMGELHRLLRDIGATVTSDRDGYLPVTITGAGSSAASVPLELSARGDVSSQFISALMLIAPLLGGLQLSLTGDVVSGEYLAMTAEVMRTFGAAVTVQPTHVTVDAGTYRGGEFVVDADWSSASYPFAAVAIAGGRVQIAGLRENFGQPEAAFLGVLTRMGCVVSEHNSTVTVSRDARQALVGIDVDMSAMSDLVPTLAVIAACATGPSRIRGVAFIRAKESDRLGDLAHELGKCGVTVRVETDGLSITPAALRAATIDPHDDHRLAMSLALLGLVQAGISVSDPDVVAKSWPNYWSAMRSGLSLV